jgi:hypothetical protein
VHRLPRRIAVASFLTAIAITVAISSEPSGHVLWTIAQVRSDAGGASIRFSLTVEAVTPLAGAELSVRAPEGVTFAAVPLPGADATSLPARTPDGALVLGELPRGRRVVLDFTEASTGDTGGIAVFTITGTLPDGTVIHEPFAQMVGTPRVRPTRRFGAAEFPAVLHSDTNTR